MASSPRKGSSHLEVPPSCSHRRLTRSSVCWPHPIHLLGSGSDARMATSDRLESALRRSVTSIRHAGHWLPEGSTRSWQCGQSMSMARCTQPYQRLRASDSSPTGTLETHLCPGAGGPYAFEVWYGCGVNLWQKIKRFMGADDAGNESVRPLPAAQLSGDPRLLFMTTARQVVEEMTGTADVKEDLEKFSLTFTIDGHGPICLLLGNIYEESRELDPEEKVRRIARAVAAFVQSPVGPEARKEAASERLVAVVRSPSMLGGIGKPVVHRPFMPCLIEALAIDLDDGISYVTSEELTEWDWAPDEAFEKARAMLAASTPDSAIELYDPGAPYPIWHYAKDDDYEASRLVIPGWLASFASRVKGRPVAAIPFRNMIVITGDGDDGAVQRLARLAKAEFDASPRGISPALYTVNDAGEVIPFLLPEDHPLARDVKRGHVELAAYEYGCQKQMLERQYAAEGIDVFVASYTGLDHKVHGITSYAVWPENVPTSLPIVERVAFGGGVGAGRWTAMVPWEAVSELASGCWELESHVYPPRMRTLRWPDEETLAFLRARAIA